MRPNLSSSSERLNTGGRAAGMRPTHVLPQTSRTMPTTPPQVNLSRRERQIMDVVYRLGRASVNEVQERLPEPPSYSAVRALMRILEEKGHLKHEQDGPRYVYLPTVPRESARRTALTHMVRTFFNGSTEAAVAALLDSADRRLSDAELERITDLVDQARQQGR
jgi:BlaI family transcriptional regulator, penicillinase repressor